MYIVKFSKLDKMLDSIQEYDAYLELVPNIDDYKAPTININTCKDSNDPNNILLLNMFITNNITFNDNDQICNIDSNNYKFIILFDKNSSSAFSNFKKRFEDLNNTTKKIIFYDNNNIKYIGETVLQDGKYIMNGNGTMYYDDNMYMTKYVGEFEDNYFDGIGTFYNYDKTIYIKCNNISNGYPVMKGKLYINFKKYKETIEINFEKVYEYLNINNKNDKINFVIKDTFVNNVANIFITDKCVSQLLFEEKTIHEQNIEIWKLLDMISNNMISNEMISNNMISNNISNNVISKNIDKYLLLVLFTIMLFNFYILTSVNVYQFSCSYK